MGWSLDLLTDAIDKVFGDIEHNVVRPDSIRPSVYFDYAGEISLVQKRRLVALFPDEIFVMFHPNSMGIALGGEPTSPIAATEEPDGK